MPPDLEIAAYLDAFHDCLAQAAADMRSVHREHVNPINHNTQSTFFSNPLEQIPHATAYYDNIMWH